MMNPFRTITALLTSILLLTALGCDSKRPTTSTSGFPVINWRSQSEDAVPGIDCAAVFTSVANDQLMLVVWTDIDPGKGGFGRSASRTDITLRSGELSIPVHWTMEDDKTGTVTVGDAQYEMDDGTWFLVSTQTDPITVYQLHRNPSRKQLTKEEFRALAKTDDDIADFFRKAAEVE